MASAAATRTSDRASPACSTASSSRGLVSAIRSSTVGYFVETRASQYRCEASSTTPEATRSATSASYACLVRSTSCEPVTGKRANHMVR